MKREPHYITQAMADALAVINPESAERFLRIYREPSGSNLSPHAHIAHGNIFWRLQLGRQPISTTSVRECLLDNCSVEDWIRLFKTQVAPAAVSLGLPTTT